MNSHDGLSALLAQYKERLDTYIYRIQYPPLGGDVDAARSTAVEACNNILVRITKLIAATPDGCCSLADMTALLAFEVDACYRVQNAIAGDLS